MKEFNTLDDFQFQGKTVILRVDINCPLNKETLEIEDDNRIRQIIPTLRELLDKEAKVVVLAHQGRPGDWDFTCLEDHAEILSKYLGKPVAYIDDLVGEKAISAIKGLTQGNAILLKNVRELPYEQDKKSMDDHAKCELITTLAPLADYFINDAFATAHRSQCSLIGFPAVLPSAVGRLMQKELSALSAVFQDPAKPCVFILGGAKFGDSIKVIDRVLKNGTADWVILVGLSANAFLFARGVNLGEKSTKFLESEFTPESLEAAKTLFKERGERILLPFDVAVEIDGQRRDMMVGDLPIDLPILDVGKFSVAKFSKVLSSARTIFMSGPAGMIEKEQFALGTKEIMTAVVHSKAFTLIGGGHTVGAAERFGLYEKFSYVSTAGGALETYLLGKPLPAVEALKTACRRVD